MIRDLSVPASQARTTRRRGPSLLTRLRRDRVMLLLAVPGLCFFVLFHYVPLLGYVVAFEDYTPFAGFVDSPFVGLDNFQQMLQDPQFWNAVTNTVVISLLQLVFFFPAPLGLALLLSSIISPAVRRFVQTVVYLPHFISWVIIVAIFQEVLGGAGIVNHVLTSAGMHAVNIMSNPDLFKPLVVLQVIWKDTGWSTIIFLAALLAIDPNLYEAAAVDGAGRWRRIWHITLPGILPITIFLLILRLGHILSVGFEQILLQRDNVGQGAGEILDTFVYFHGVVQGNWGVPAAAGLIKAVIGAALILGANRLAHSLGQDGIYR
jgi:putative aldouronate transport system permease protein